MRTKPILFLALLAGLLFCSCSQDAVDTKNLYDDWWPVHATGSIQNDLFTAQWDGDLSRSGAIEVTFVSRTNPNLQYTDTRYYPAYSFRKSGKDFCTIDISSRDFPASRYLKFYLKGGKIFFEVPKENGTGSVTYGEGVDFRFLNDDMIQFEGVTYQRYSVWYASHKPEASDLLGNGERIPVMIYE